MISVTIDPNRFDNPIHQGAHVLAALQQAGIPATGVLYPQGVESGTLSVSSPDLVTGSVVWSWSED